MVTDLHHLITRFLERSVSLKAKVAVEAIKAHKTTAQIAQMIGVHPTQVGGWKKQPLAGLPDIFGNGRKQIRQQADTGTHWTTARNGVHTVY